MADSSRIPLSVLDLSPLGAGMSYADALNGSFKLAQVADRYGYYRYWMAEHHSSQVFMSSATSVLLSRAAERTRNIRIGAGGIMLPNQVPLIVAEHYGTLATIFPDRIDLGIGRAPLTDKATARALRRSSDAIDDYMSQVKEIHGYLATPAPRDEIAISGAEAGVFGEAIKKNQQEKKLHALPGEGTEVPLWVLGSTDATARMAAQLGLPYSFASHFAATNFESASWIYHKEFNANAPTASIEKPYVMGSAHVICAPSDEEAQYLASSILHLTALIRRGQASRLPEPVEDLSTVLSEKEIADLGNFNGLVIVGSPQTVAEKIEQTVKDYGFDEMILATFVHDQLARRRSYQLLAREWGIANIMPDDI